MARVDSFGREIDAVLFEGNSYVKKIIFNRPRQFNSLTYAMIPSMLKKLKEYENDSTVKLVILKGNGKAFCAGGDLKTYYKLMIEGHWTFGVLYHKKQLILSYLLATYKKPLVALIDGVVMGTGVGLSVYAPYRIVTENTVFAMPEAAIGYFPDIGASHFLSRLPGFFGEYLGLTGAKLDGAGMIACGLATHFVLSKDLPMLENELEGLTSSDTTAISETISKFVQQSNAKQDNAYYNRLKIVNKCFSKETVEDILFALEEEAENGDQKWIHDAIKSMKSTCPSSLKIFLKTVREGRSQSFEQCFVQEYILIYNLSKGTTVINNFYEGTRAMLLNKDKNPKWQPAKLELVTQEMINECFKSIEDDDDEWDPLNLPPRSSIFVVAKSKL